MVQGDWGTKLRVGTALSLLVGGKVSYATTGSPASVLTIQPDIECRSTLLFQEHR